MHHSADGDPIDGCVTGSRRSRCIRDRSTPTAPQPRQTADLILDARRVTVARRAVPVTGVPEANTAPDVAGRVRASEPMLPPFVASSQLAAQVVDRKGGRVAVERKRPVLVV